METYSRRRYVATIGALGVATVAGCSSWEEWSTTADGTTNPLPDESNGWAQYGRTRGRTGHAADVRLEDPREDWRFDLAGGMAPPAVVGNRVVVHGIVGGESGGDGETDGAVVVSLRAEDGTRQWRRDLPGLGGGYSGAPPIVHHGSVYVGHVGRNGLYALDARDGSPRWRRETRNSVNEAPLGVGDLVFASTGDELLALDLRGRHRWTYQTGTDRVATASPAFDGDRVLYTTRGIGSVVAIDPAEGGLSAWHYQADRQFGEPTVGNGRVYVPGSDRLHVIDLASGEGHWTKEAAPSTGVATDGTRLFAPTDAGDLVAYATGDGSEHWQRSLATSEGVYLRTRPLVTARSVVVTTEKPQLDERVTTYALDRETGDTRWRVDQPGNISAGAVAADDRVYVPVYWSTRDTGGTLVALSG